MITIAVDAMGGDHAPKSEVEGALRAVKAFDVRVVLVGRESVIKDELNLHGKWKNLPIEITNASEVITMEDSAAKAMRTKKDSSIRVACRLVRDGVAAGVVSAGNTGAAMATSKMVQGMIRGVERPALATAFPTLKGTPTVLVDIGANVDASAEMLAQFAFMGHIYSRAIFGIPKPRVGLLSIGEEEHKGNALTHATTPLLKQLPIHFIGNVEGRDLYTGLADVIVCDGFIGNVALKVSEGLVEVFKSMLKESLSSTITRQVGAVLAKNGFSELKRRTDYSEYGGAPLLGVRGVCIICHGRSNPNAIKNAIRVAAEYANNSVNDRIEEGLATLRESK
ncbi:phosphate acyltransferase PlsX [Bryobacter aggregatus]|uniref:phosphate acyltransferase PlsX n=1 Tax=Bryobacter aggregatus TaxID=360054 RepID=UPI0004E18EC1|nr:phosphate acyltransferase PlsX [Bryobacter aggregatus]